MGKKKNHFVPVAAESSGTKTIDIMKALNNQLVKEVTECRKQIEQLQFQLDSWASHHSMVAKSEHGISSIARSEHEVSSSQTEAAAHDNTEIAMKKAESAAAQPDATEMRLCEDVKEKDASESNMEHTIEEDDCNVRCVEKSLEQWKKLADAEHGRGKKWKKWICCATVATVSFCVATAVVTICCSKSSIPKN